MKKIGIDLHGVLSDYPAKFLPLLKKLCKTHEVHILSGPPSQEVLNEMFDLGYRWRTHFHFTFSVVDHLKFLGVKMWEDDKNTWWAEREHWWASKGNYCEEKGIELLIDNSIEYKDYLPEFTNFVFIKDEQDIDKAIKLLEKLYE